MPENVIQPQETPSLGEQIIGKTRLGEEAKKRAEDQTLFNEHHQTSFPVNPSINSSIIGDFNKGPNPGAKTALPSNEDYVKNFVNYLGKADSWAHDEYGYGKTVSYGAGYRNMNFDRYYSQSGFKKLGFSPFRDNEAVYNDKTSGVADFGRMASGWMGMAGLGARDMWSEWFDSGFNNDVVHSDEMSKRMANMTSSRDTAMGWLTNFGANTAYTAGILGEMAAEELGLLGATALTGGLDAEVTVPEMIARGGLGAKKLAQGFQSMNKIRKSLAAIKTASDARELFTFANAADKVVGAAKWLNPLSRTAEFVGDYSELKNLSNFAKLKRGAGSLYRDIREINAVTSESKLEGGSAENDLNQQEINDYYNLNGKLPEGDDAEKIYQNAKKAGVATQLANMPLIYFSNKIVFKNALKGFRPLEGAFKSELEGALASKILVKDAAAKTVEFVDKNSWRGIKNIFKPGNLLKGSLRYTLAELTEGLQETSQDAISAAYKDYYDQFYKDPGLASLKSSFAKGLGSQLSAQGLSTFLSGFLMGGVLQGPQKLVFEGVPNLTQKLFKPEEYKAYRDSKLEYVNSVTNAMNDVYKNSASYVKAISNIDKNFVLQRNTSKNMDESLDENDQKAFQDNKDESIFNHIHTLLRSGQTDTLTDQVKALRELTPKELAEAFGETEDANLHSKLDSFSNQVDYLKKRYDVVEKKMVNPFDPSKIKKTDSQAFIQESIARQEFDELKKMALFSRYSFDRTLDRMTNIVSNAASNKPLANATSTDFTLLFSPEQIQDEISSLKTEIATFGTLSDPTTKKQTRKKRKKLEALQDVKKGLIGFQASLKERSNKSQKTGEQIQASEDVVSEHAKLLFGSYNKYVKSIANLSNDHVLDENVAEAFRGLKDFYELHHDSVKLASSVNFLANPETFKEYLQRAVEVRTVLEEKKVELLKSALEEFIKKSEHNQLLNQLYQIGVFFAPDQVDALIKEDKIPTKFYDATQFGEIDMDSPKGKEILDILDKYKQATAPVETPVIETPVQEAPVLTKISQSTSIELLPIELLTRLVETLKVENAKRATEERMSLENKDVNQISRMGGFKSWFQVSRIAKRIIDEFNNTGGRTTVEEVKKEPVVEKPAIPLGPEVISDEDFKAFTTTGEVPDERLKSIAEKMADQKAISERERAIFIANQIRVSELLTEILLERRFKEEAQSTPSTDQEQKVSTILDEKKIDIETRRQDELAKYSVTEGAIIDEKGDKVVTFNKDKTGYLKEGWKKFVTEKAAFAELQKAINKKYDDEIDNLEKKADAIISEELAKDLIAEVAPIRSLEDRVADVTTFEQWKALDETLTEELMTPGNELDSSLVEQLMSDKKKELSKIFSFDSIEKGEVLVMKDKAFYGKEGLAVVVEKSSKEIKVRKFGEKAGSIRIISKSQLETDVEFKYSKGMEENELTQEPTKNELKLIVESKDAIQDIITDNKKAIDDAVKKADKKTSKEADDDFFENLGCD